MLKQIGLKVLWVFVLLCGLGLIEMGITDPDFDLAARIFGGICGFILALAAVILLWLEKDDTLEVIKYAFSRDGLRGGLLPKDRVVTEDLDDTERLIRSFRTDLASYLESSGTTENDPVQKDVTQIFWYILSLQKRRLERKKIRTHMSSERLRYGGMQPVRRKKYFDGKYQICDVSETVEARQTYVSAGGKKLHEEKHLQSAWYRILNASEVGKHNLICPNCGVETTREKLIDGCDFCGTKFTVEDLGRRISDFCFRTDYEAEYARYTDTRETYAWRVGMIVGVPVLILCLIGAVLYAGDVGGPFTLRIAAVMFAAAFPTAAAVFVAEILFFIFLFPLIQAKASITYLSKRRMEALKEDERADREAEKTVRAFDPLFSISGFYADVQSKLAAIHFAENRQEAAAFSENETADRQIEARISDYRDLFDLETDLLRLDDYRVKDGMQEALVTAQLQNLSEKDGTVRKEKERIILHLVKSASCKSQTICAPSFTVCKKCGTSLSLMDGRTCPSCGNERKLSDTGWAIRSYEVQM